ncbi:peptide chain release factor 2 [bacterium]
MLEFDVTEKIQELENELATIRGVFDLDAKSKKIEELEPITLEAGFWDDQRHAQKVMQEINELKADTQVFSEFANEIENIKELYALAESEKDVSLINEIKNDLEQLGKKIHDLSFRAKLSGKFDKSNAIVTLHSGAGGTEACDWVDMIFRMYKRWAETKKYQVDIFDILPGEEAGIKSVTFIVKGSYAYGYLKAEIGIHRLVRISPFDSNKRRHTSFASCDVIPEINEDIDIKIDDKDLRIDTYRAGGAGGQHVNKTESAVRITHLLTNIVVQCQNERSQHKNKATCMKVLKAKLYEYEEEKKRKETEKHYDDKGQITWGNQIRSYVFCPYTLVKDHRTNFEIGNVQSVMDGNIDGFIDAYLSQK